MDSHMQGVARWTLTCRVWQDGLSHAGCGKMDSHMQGVASNSHMQGVARWTLTCRAWQDGLSHAGRGKMDSHMQGVARWTLHMQGMACKTNNSHYVS